MPVQSLPPFLLTTIGIAGIGACQMGINWLFMPNKPSDGPIYFRRVAGMDNWDVLMQNRDAKVFREGIVDKSQAKAAWWDFQNSKSAGA